MKNNFPEGFHFRTNVHPLREKPDDPLSKINGYWLHQLAKHYGVSVNNVCCMCGGKIEMQIFKNSGVCSEDCRKDRDDDHEPFRGGALAP